MKWILSLACAWALGGLIGRAESWPQFRGPGGDGFSESKELPIRWSEAENVTWKTAVHGKAWSSPVVWGDQVWVTSATEDGRELFAHCLDLKTGAIVRDLKLFTVENPQFAHKFNSYASPTPVIEEGRIYVTFGSPGTACLDTQTGEVLWERRDFECNHFRGAGSSPILFENLLIMNFDGSDHQFVVALDKRTGETVWRTERSVDFKDLTPEGKPEAEGDFRKAFATPHVAEFGGRPMLISSGAKAHYGYDPRTGKELWRVEERSRHSASTRPVVGHGQIYLTAGFHPGLLMAVRPSPGAESGAEVVWTSRRSAPEKPSPILHGDWLFTIEDGGVASCLNARTGEMIWNERVGGNYSASPICANGKIYFCSEQGKTTVIRAAAEFEVLATNELGDGFMASPAVAGDSLILRSRTHVYRID